MKTNKNIPKNENQNSQNEFDQILEKFNLNYTDLDFNKIESDKKAALNKIRKHTDIKIESREKKYTKIRTLHFNLRQIVAASLFLIISTGAFLTLKQSKEVDYTIIEVQKGEKITLKVSDNLTIWLNSDSEIKIPIKQSRKTECILSGEAYFEFHPNHKIKKLHVKSNNLVFDAAESSFYINSKINNNQLIAHISEGEVLLKNKANQSLKSLVLNSGEKVSYISNADFIAIEKTDNQNYLAWKTGIMEFENSYLKDVLKELSHYFLIPFKLENNELSYKQITTSFTSPMLDEVLSEIQSHLNCNISGDGSQILIN